MRIEEKNLKILHLEQELQHTKAAFEKLTVQLRTKEAMEAAIKAKSVRQKAYTDMLLEAIPCLIILLDANNCFQLSTRSFLDAIHMPNFDFISGLPFKEVMGKVLPLEDLNVLEEKLSLAANTKNSLRFDLFLDFNGSGKKRYYSIECRKVEVHDSNSENQESGLLLIFVDNTDMEAQKVQAEAANRSKSDFLAAMSHEIRTPMNAIIGLNDILARTPLNESQTKYLADIRTSSNTLLSIINDILDFSKIEAGKMELVNAPYQLHFLLDHLNSMFVLIFAEKDLTFKVEISPDLPVWVEGDEMKVRQILTNLISNAAKYTRVGGAVLKASFDRESNMLVFEVIDTGIGVKEEDVKKLFLPFERFELKRNRNIQGAGLGLPISLKYCTLMDGVLEVESHYGEGSRFTAKLPYLPALPAELPAEEEGLVFAAPELKVLVVDDIEINLEVAQAMLEAFSIDADTALSGFEAIQKVTETKYDVVFMDHMMPMMDGIETAQRIKAMGGQYATLPIVALTANVVNDAQNLFLENGFSDFISKPLEMRNLSICLRKLLKKRGW
jgi:signal transduction histidine kinase/CheY-like chemotaxis protein